MAAPAWADDSLLIEMRGVALAQQWDALLAAQYIFLLRETLGNVVA